MEKAGGWGLAVGVRALLIDFEYLLLRDDYTTFGQGFFRPVKLGKKNIVSRRALIVLNVSRF